MNTVIPWTSAFSASPTPWLSWGLTWDLRPLLNTVYLTENHREGLGSGHDLYSTPRSFSDPGNILPMTSMWKLQSFRIPTGSRDSRISVSDGAGWVDLSCLESFSLENQSGRLSCHSQDKRKRKLNPMKRPQVINHLSEEEGQERTRFQSGYLRKIHGESPIISYLHLSLELWTAKCIIRR